MSTIASQNNSQFKRERERVFGYSSKYDNPIEDLSVKRKKISEPPLSFSSPSSYDYPTYQSGIHSNTLKNPIVIDIADESSINNVQKKSHHSASPKRSIWSSSLPSSPSPKMKSIGTNTNVAQVNPTSISSTSSSNNQFEQITSAEDLRASSSSTHSTPTSLLGVTSKSNASSSGWMSDTRSGPKSSTASSSSHISGTISNEASVNTNKQLIQPQTLQLLNEDDSEVLPHQIELEESKAPLFNFLQCVICSQLLKDPRQCPNGCMFHDHCINQMFRSKSKECPKCHVVISPSTISKCSFFDEFILHSSIKCKNRFSLNHEQQYEIDKEGCGESHFFPSIIDHQQECGFKLVTCDFSRSFTKPGDDDICPLIRRKDLPSHYKSCVHRIINCNLCSLEHTFKDMDSHMQECQMASIECFQCQMHVLRKDMDYHIKEECMETDIPCPDPFCMDIIKRKNRDSHMKESELKHVQNQNLDLKNQLIQLRTSINQSASANQNMDSNRSNRNQLSIKEKGLSRCIIN